MQGFALNDPKAMKLYELCGRTGAVSAAHWDPGSPFSNRAADTGSAGLPETTFVGAHMGGHTFWKGGHKGTGRPV